MKKFTVLTVFALTMGFLSPTLPAAHATSVADQILNQAISKYPSVAKAQDLIRIKEDLTQGNRDDLLGLLAQAAVKQVGREDLAGAAATAVAGGNLNEAMKAAVNQAVQRKVGDKLGQYQEALTLINSLLQHSSLNPASAQDNNSLAGAPKNYRAVMNMTATAYGPGTKDNGHWGNLTYLGGQVRKGVVAVDPKVIPLGTKLWVEGYGPAVAEDEGSAIVGNRVDLAFNNRQEALDYGIKPVKVYLMN
ncbi:MAG: 3D domain-containing protein [Negativicutes bacterium]|nr:3D domain-containing protein [Negativicutes bacterium]